MQRLEHTHKNKTRTYAEAGKEKIKSKDAFGIVIYTPTVSIQKLN